MGRLKAVEQVAVGGSHTTAEAMHLGSALTNTISAEASAVIEAGAKAQRAWADVKLLARVQDEALRRTIGDDIHNAITELRHQAQSGPLKDLTDRDWAAIGRKLTQLRTSEKTLKDL